MTALTPQGRAALRATVRLKSSDSRSQLPDSVIDSFIDSADNFLNGVYDTNGILADVWEYLSRGETHVSRSVGNLSLGQPLGPRRAAYYRALSFSGGGAKVVSGDIKRTDRNVWTEPGGGAP